MINKHINEREEAVELIAAIQESNKNINFGILGHIGT